MSICKAHKERVIGYNASVDTSLDDISELGVNVIPLPTEPILLEAVSDSVNDTIGGTGINKITIHGLGEDWNELSTNLTLSGLTAVATLVKFRRINIVHSAFVGSGGVAAGNILIRAAGGGTVYSKISVGGNASLQCHYTVPDNRIGRIMAWSAGLNTTKKDTVARAILRITADPFSHELLSGVYVFHDIITGQNETIPQIINSQEDLMVPGRADIKISAQQMEGTGLTEAAGKIVIELIKPQECQ